MDIFYEGITFMADNIPSLAMLHISEMFKQIKGSRDIYYICYYMCYLTKYSQREI